MKPIFEQERQFFFNKTGIELPTDCWRNGTKIYLDCTCTEPLYTFKIQNKNINIFKDFSKQFIDYKQKKIKELINIYNDQINNLTDQSVEFLYNYIKCNYTEKYVVNHSGGKDSTVAFEIWNKVLEKLKLKEFDIFNNINWEINFSNTSNDTADTYKYIKTELPQNKLHILNPKIGFYQWIINVKNYFIPSVMVRNCCSTYKEGQINNYYNKNEVINMVLGLRKHESTKRSGYTWIMDYNYIKDILGMTPNIPELWTRVNPIIEWEDEHIWLYILRENLKYNNQYNLGFNRCGCLICPYQSDYIDLLIEEYYPKQWQRWVNILHKNYDITYVKERLKWTIEEWVNGKWKQGTSVEQELIQKKGTMENIKKLSEIKGINEDVAEKYFKRKCRCGKKLNPDEIALSLKVYGRNMDLSQLECKKCFCKTNNLVKKEYFNMINEFRNSGCDLF